MRTALSVFFTLLGIACTYLFAVGAADAAPTGAPLLERLLAPFTALDFAAVVSLQGAFVSFLIAFLFRSSARGRPGSVADGSMLKTLLETALSMDVLLIGGVIAVFAALGLGWIGPDSLTTGTLGALFALATLQVAVGVILAVLLHFQKRRNRTLYYSVLTALAIEGGFIGTVLVMGFR